MIELIRLDDEFDVRGKEKEKLSLVPSSLQLEELDEEELCYLLKLRRCETLERECFQEQGRENQDFHFGHKFSVAKLSTQKNKIPN